MSEDQKYRNELLNVAKFTGISFFGILFLNLKGYVNSIIITRNVDPEFFGLFVLSIRIVILTFLIVKFYASFISLSTIYAITQVCKFTVYCSF